MDSANIDTSAIAEWRSVLTLVVFILTNCVVLFPFRVPCYIPRLVQDALMRILSAGRVISPSHRPSTDDDPSRSRTLFARHDISMNMVTAPILACLFLLALSAIDGDDVRAGIIGTHNISPIDVMLFFITLAYVAISVDASGLIRWLAYRVLQLGGKSGRRLFCYLYLLFTILGALVGNDPIVLSGTPFLAYMTRISDNIQHPRAWIFMQFSVANIVSAILVSSNPTNLVLAGAFEIRFINYSANMILPVVFTVIILLPYLLFVVFRTETLIPRSITMYELPQSVRDESPENPCIPYVNGATGETEMNSYVHGTIQAVRTEDETQKLMELAEVMHPFLDKQGAIFGSLLIAATLILVLVLNAVNPTGEEIPVFWITVPAAVIMLSWDLGSGWLRREHSRKVARNGRRKLETARLPALEQQTSSNDTYTNQRPSDADEQHSKSTTEKHDLPDGGLNGPMEASSVQQDSHPLESRRSHCNQDDTSPQIRERITLVSVISQAWAWSRETFPTATFVLSHLPLSLVPFAFSMFILVQGLVTKGWVPVIAHGWDAWVDATGTVGAIGGMGFLSVTLCNFTGTNIGTTILLCRILQSWEAIRRDQGVPIPERIFWSSVYSMALGVNYGAFSLAFSASLAGLLWRDILERKRIHVRARDFARYNVPIILVSMIVGSAVLVGQMYVTRGTEPHQS